MLKDWHLDMFRELAKNRDSRPAEKKLLILSTPRCGSSMLCDKLANTGLVGFGEEWLNEFYIAAYCHTQNKQFTFNLQSYMQWVIEHSTRGTGVFVSNIHIGQLLHAQRHWVFYPMDTEYTHVIYLYREDKISQAVSLARAYISDKWRHNCKGNGFEPSRALIAESLRTILEHDEYAKLRLGDRIAASYSYEELCEGWLAYDEILAALEIDPPNVYTTDLKIQRDSKSAELKADFTNFIFGVS